MASLRGGSSVLRGFATVATASLLLPPTGLGTLVAMTHVSKQILLGNQDFFPIKPGDYGKFIVLSLGTGSPRVEGEDVRRRRVRPVGHPRLAPQRAHRQLRAIQLRPRRHPRLRALPGALLRAPLPPHLRTTTSPGTPPPSTWPRRRTCATLLPRQACRVDVETGRNVADAACRGTNEEELTLFARMLSTIRVNNRPTGTDAQRRRNRERMGNGWRGGEGGKMTWGRQCPMGCGDGMGSLPRVMVTPTRTAPRPFVHVPGGGGGGGGEALIH
uniref:Uncharacterized protein n=1 Tax=Oryza punctata TaxID=4537 RepID=A0A0E0LUF1_ORYPU